MPRQKHSQISLDAAVRARRIPFSRYFFYIGGILLGLLFILDASLPKLPAPVRGNGHLPVIRIVSDRKWPERIIYDTSLPTIVPAQPATIDARVPTPAAGVYASGNIRAAFAEMQSPQANPERPSHPKMREPARSREHKIVKRRAVPRTMLVTRQTKFGWFGPNIW
jgi:hypothetical protein